MKGFMKSSLVVSNLDKNGTSLFPMGTESEFVYECFNMKLEMSYLHNFENQKL